MYPSRILLALPLLSIAIGTSAFNITKATIVYDKNDAPW